MSTKDRAGKWTNFLMVLVVVVVLVSPPSPVVAVSFVLSVVVPSCTASTTLRNSMTIPPFNDRLIKPSPNADGVSTWDPMPSPGL
mmetsp:Transcript_51919/g.78856  ORF Transcript_51919/g.78856 Transcript_51919/m.78856 type:complete len:85 (-) Transcript_51919:73-327(-)